MTEQSGTATAEAAPDLRRDLLQHLLRPLGWLLVLPVCGLLFTAYGRSDLDQQILSSIDRNIDESKDVTPADKAERKAYFRALPPSAACTSSDPREQPYRDAVCDTFSQEWQFLQAWRASLAALVLGLLAIAAAVGLGLLAFTNRSAQYWSFLAGWRLLSAVSALEAVLQGALAVFLAFWVTALFLHVYFLKLIVLAAICALGAVAVAVFALFKAVPEPDPLDAEVIGPDAAPALHARLHELAGKIGTAPPATVVAGIDDNFFVTEAGLRLADPERKIEGRALFVSLPLLRVLGAVEADAVLAHELAHFQGGDTAASARLGPALVKYGVYLQSLAEGGVTLPAYYLMLLFRVIFEHALAAEHRRRELLADAVAVKATSADDLARSLLKVAAYSSFRAATEHELFSEKKQQAAALGLQARIDSGLAGHVASASFLTQVKKLDVPHPFDTHPPLAERLAQAGASVRLEDAAQVVAAPPAPGWVDGVAAVAAVEARLWGRYEERFNRAHEMSLAFRYLPKGPEEKALVEKYFPAQVFTQKDGAELRIDFVGFTLPNLSTPIAFSEVTGARLEEQAFSKYLVITYKAVGSGAAGLEKKVNLSKLGDRAEAFKEAFGNYWGRDQVTRKQEGT